MRGVKNRLTSGPVKNRFLPSGGGEAGGALTAGHISYHAVSAASTLSTVLTTICFMESVFECYTHRSSSVSPPAPPQSGGSRPVRNFCRLPGNLWKNSTFANSCGSVKNFRKKVVDNFFGKLVVNCRGPLSCESWVEGVEFKQTH
jgi:hypothetical protein